MALLRSCAILGLLVALCLGSVATRAWPADLSGDLPGEDDPVFQTALKLWLRDDEKESLPALAGLARNGNTAGRLLLAMIDKTPELQGPWLALLPKNDRITLLRAPGGFSGTSWLREAGDLPLAALWLDMLDSRGTIETALSFSTLREDRALRTALLSLEARQETGFADFAGDPRFPAELFYLVWREWQKAGASGAGIETAMSDLHPGDPQRALFGQAVSEGDLTGWLETAPSAMPLRVFCDATCPQSPRGCLRAAYSASAGYRRLLALGSPLQGLISNERFFNSDRGRATLLRRALSFAFLNETRLGMFRGINACFAVALEREGHRF